MRDGLFSRRGGMHYYFDVPAESPSVRDCAALLAEGVEGYTLQQVVAIPSDFYYGTRLQEVLSGQRFNGTRAIVRFIKGLAQRELDKSEARPFKKRRRSR